MENKPKINLHVVATVWRHWKSTFVRNGIGVFATFLFFSGQAYLDLMLKPTQWKIAFDELARGGDPWPAFNIIILLGCLGWISARIGEVAIVLSESKIIKELKDYALKELMGKSTHFFSTHSSGGLVAKAKRFAGVSERVIDEFIFSIFKSGLFVVYLIIYTAFTIPKLSIVFFVWVCLFVVVTVVISRFRMKYDLLSSNADSKTTGHLSDILLSLLTLRVSADVAHEYKSFTDITQKELKLRRMSWIIGNVQWSCQGVLVLCLEIYCMYFILRSVQLKTETIGTAVMVQTYIVSLTMHMWNLGQSLVKVRTSFADAYEMSEMLDHLSNEPIGAPSCAIETDHNGIRLENTCFSYGDREPVIKDLNFLFKSGRSYGVVGRSGSGKTTLIKLLLRLYDKKSGQIHVRGIDIGDIDKYTLRSWIGYVQQQPLFPSRTVREIIAMGKRDATDDEIMLAAKKASCNFIWEKLPKGLDTHVGERGIKLSGGEAQRLAIASVLLKDPPIVILDEPTSALDAETEHCIQDSIKNHFHGRGKTLIVIAHRLSTVAVLDEVIMMKDGKIIISAPHSELLKISDEYSYMWNLQTNP